MKMFVRLLTALALVTAPLSAAAQAIDPVARGMAAQALSILSGDTPASCGTVSASEVCFQITGTWNNGAIAFPGALSVNMTDSASGAASRLLDLRVGGATRFSVDKSGLFATAGTSSGLLLGARDGTGDPWRLFSADGATLQIYSDDAAANALTITSSGVVTTPGAVASAGLLPGGSANARVTSAAANQLTFSNNAQSASATWTVGSDLSLDTSLAVTGSVSATVDLEADGDLTVGGVLNVGGGGGDPAVSAGDLGDSYGVYRNGEMTILADDDLLLGSWAGVTKFNAAGVEVGRVTTAGLRSNQFLALGTTSSPALIVPNIAEVVTVAATAATGTVNYDVSTQSIVYFTSNASANWTLNLRSSSGATLDSLMSTGQAITVAHLVKQGATPYYNSSVQVDGTTSGVTTIWQGGTPSGGTADSVDVYTYTVIKTGSATFTVLATQSSFS